MIAPVRTGPATSAARSVALPELNLTPQSTPSGRSAACAQLRHQATGQTMELLPDLESFATESKRSPRHRWQPSPGLPTRSKEQVHRHLHRHRKTERELDRRGGFGHQADKHGQRGCRHQSSASGLPLPESLRSRHEAHWSGVCWRLCETEEPLSVGRMASFPLSLMPACAGSPTAASVCSCDPSRAMSIALAARA